MPPLPAPEPGHRRTSLRGSGFILSKGTGDRGAGKWHASRVVAGARWRGAWGTGGPRSAHARQRRLGGARGGVGRSRRSGEAEPAGSPPTAGPGSGPREGSRASPGFLPRGSGEGEEVWGRRERGSGWARVASVSRGKRRGQCLKRGRARRCVFHTADLSVPQVHRAPPLRGAAEEHGTRGAQPAGCGHGEQ